MNIKSIFYIIILIIVPFFSQSQTIDYPRYEKDSLGQDVIIMTIPQAMRLDNNSELLLLFEKLNAQLGEYDSACVKVINDKEKVIAIKKLEISTLKENLATKDSQIVTLQHNLAEHVVRIGLLEKQLANRQGIISEKDQQITNLKIKMLFGGVGGGVAIIGLILGLILIN